MVVQIEMTLQDLQVLNAALDNMQLKGSDSFVVVNTISKIRAATEKLAKALQEEQAKNASFNPPAQENKQNTTPVYELEAEEVG